ncbi:MAG: archaeosine synthase subunit alpha [Methanobacteriota archaeon]
MKTPMQYSVLKRDGPARIGNLTLNTTSITTPSIAFVHTSRCPSPEFADLLLTNDNEKHEKPAIHVLGSIFSPEPSKKTVDESLTQYLIYPRDIPKEVHHQAIQKNKKTETSISIIPGNIDIISEAVQDNPAQVFIVANAAQLLSHHSAFAEYLTQVRAGIGYQKLLYLPSIGDPTNLALLTYLGVDLLDSTTAFLAARNHLLFFSTGHQKTTEIPELPCHCPICQNVKGDPTTMTFTQILQHNYYALFTELKKVRNAINQGSLRELVETRVRTNPEHTAILRTLDLNYYPFLEERIPITRKSQLIATTKESLCRPEIHRFQDRVLDRYRKPPSTKVLLLLPCSAKKPYSFSKTHTRFREQLFSIQNPAVVHEVILTSPLGLVPRELELMYPASSYDIPVTGHWDEDEKKMIRTLLQQYLEYNKYEKILVHLPSSLQEFILDLLPDPLITCIDTPTSDASLQSLLKNLTDATLSYKQVSSSIRVLENMETFASYQFGRKPAQKLFSNGVITGKYPYLKLFSEKKQIGMLTPERGMISLTLAGAERLLDSKISWVEAYDDVTLKGSLLAPGVKDADDLLRIGDEVIVINQHHTLLGVGVAQMNGQEIKTSTHGEAVKIRHHT